MSRSFPLIALTLLFPLNYVLIQRWYAAPSFGSCAAAHVSTLTLFAVLACLCRNRVCRSGVVLMAVGVTSNAAATLLNGGRMPFVGPFEPHVIWVRADASTRVPWLIDRINGVSVGDLPVTLGGILLAAGVVSSLWRLLDSEAVHHERRLMVIGGLYALAITGVSSGVPFAVGGAVLSTAPSTLADVRRGVAQAVRSLTLPPAKPETIAAIRAASEAYRLNTSCMLDLAQRVSVTGRDPRAYMPGAASVGLYRFTPATWLWASRGQYGHTLPLEARDDDRISAWVAAYVMDLRGGKDWGNVAGVRDCRLYPEHGPPPWDRYRAGARPYDPSVSRYYFPGWCDWCERSRVEGCASEWGWAQQGAYAIERILVLHSWERCAELWSDLGPGVQP